MPVWSDQPRPDPEACRESDEGLFEVTVRDGRARLGKLYTKHGVLETPALLPVINPNIRTIEPREMWDRYGIGALITNSYIIWKHDKLKEIATTNGVHELLNYPGVIMTDSGTFQSYVYGDVEVGVEEIVEFQRSIGVDIATMLDVFSRPDMKHSEVSAAVEETLERSQLSVDTAQDTMLNGPIQGGLFPDLRKKSAMEMSKFDFSIHPIGGIVPIMEQQRYREYAKIMLSTLPFLPSNRPVHMFGCGHPMLFPMSIALGADLFDSAAYALFARDGRILTPWGTEKLEGLIEWPIIMPCISSHTPEEVRKMDKDDRMKLLSKYNLEITLAELSRCRQAVRDGDIWRLVEQRSHQHPALRDAFLWLTTNPATAKYIKLNHDDIPLDEITSSQDFSNQGGWESGWNWILDAQLTPRKGGEQWAGSDTFSRPHITAARNLLFDRWHPRKSTEIGSDSVLIFYGQSGPWRDRCDAVVAKILQYVPGLEIMINTPIGLVPYSLEDLNPFCHIEGPDWLWKNKLDMAKIAQELDNFGLAGKAIIPVDLRKDNFETLVFEKMNKFESSVKAELVDGQIKILDEELFKQGHLKLNRLKAADKFSVLFNINHEVAQEMSHSMQFVVNKYGRIKNVLSSSGQHLASFRLGDGGLSLNNSGAIELFARRRKQLPKTFSQTSIAPYAGEGLAVVVVDDDAEPFIRKGRNVFHGFVLACDPWLRPGEACLICDKAGNLLGHGVSVSTVEDLASMKKGVAIKTRDGIKEDA
ncbi:MAG TPA: tRNA guanosine(15) transglycosylase TgtA [Candidatus Poseidoniaceae archaeon]|nr:MAG TPA: tRNA guanosine(15) transglycosylase TgtA [Candidatus Poseidoniales archaeon]HII23598.1 tRNA guanosine(15) transglycosylase TgtA [Candidatus Poseidoniaceae archaeon]|tara:strand:+ start:687 stop:2957 length:2271 start_codon:yes stop_codon:yes gene_type:complete